jgi:hypothetical protein
MVYQTGEAQVVNDPQANTQGGQVYANEQETANQDQKPLVNQGEQTDDSQSQQPANNNTGEAKSEDVQELENKLGVSTDQLGQPQPEQQPEQDQQQSQEELDPQTEKAIERYLQNKFGLPPDQIKQQFEEMQQFKAQQQVEQQKQALQQEWGDNFNERIDQVKQYFNNRLTSEQQQALDNADGARLIWAKIQQEQQANQPQPPNFQPQQGQSPEQAVAQPSTSYMYTKSQLKKMSLKEYQDNIKDIEYAFNNNLVKQDA